MNTYPIIGCIPKSRRFQFFFLFFYSVFALAGTANQLFNASTGFDNQPHSQTDPGIPFMRHYFANDYNAHRENWAILQDDRGMMYFGNSRGILEFDGVSWRLIQTPNASIVRSLALGKDNRIYAGAMGDFGYLAPDSTGDLQFVSLLELVPDTQRDFGDVWQTIVAADGIYFRSRKYLFRLLNEVLTVWEAESSFYSPFSYNGRFYIVQSRHSLMVVDGDSLVTAPAGDEFQAIYPYAMLPYGNDQLLLGAYSGELFLYDQNTLVSFPTSADKLLKSHSIYHGAILPDSTYAFSVTGLGIIIIDRDGGLVQILDKSAGLSDNEINYLYVDRDGSLWLAHKAGISRIEYSSGFTHFDERIGLRGTVRDILRFNGALYAATSLGVFYLAATTSSPGHENEPLAFRTSKFIQLPEITVPCWALLSDGESLLIASDHGVWELKGDRFRLLSMDQSQTFTLLRSRHDSLRIYAGLIDGVGELRFNGGEWNYAGKIHGIHEDIRYMTEDHNGALWLGTRYQGVLRVESVNRIKSDKWNIERYDTTNGLPAIGLNYPFETPLGNRFATRQGLHYFDEETRR
ncbi:MAG: two-component regulator propeller domain-containing protein, partial [Balneolaceae bacterium]